jgi:P4 family phage/plasmid primase-like protien
MTSMGERKGKWIIGDADYPQFLNLLHDYLFLRHGRPMAFVEQPRRGEPKPLLIDLDFRFSSETGLVRLITQEQIEAFCEKLTEGVRTFFDLSGCEKLRYFVTLRPAPYQANGVRKDGVHILCPDIALGDEKQKVLRNWMLSQKAISECFGETGYLNADTDIYDESMVRKQGWIFYGESKPSIPPYSLSTVFKYVPAENTWETEDPGNYTSRELLEMLSVRYKVRPETATVLSDSQEAYEAMKVWGEAPSPGLEDPGATNHEAVGTTTTNPYLDMIQVVGGGEASAEDRVIIRRFVMECLGPEWYEKYEKWIRVGWCLHNIEPSEEMFQLWMDFSNQSSKASGNNVAQLRRDWFHGWRKDGDGPRLTERSLRKWAKDANPERYKEIQSEYLSEIIKQELEPTHFHVAKLMRKIYGTSYIASVGARSTEWYKYDDKINRWAKLNQGIEFRNKVSTDVAKAINDAKGKMLADAARANNDIREILTEKLKNLSKVEQSVYNNGFCESVVKMAVNQFYEEDFQNKLNVNPNLFGCKNGVLELRVPGTDGRDHVVFRQGRPEDYVSFLAGQNMPEMGPIEYHPYDAADPRQAEIADFFVKLFPEVEMRRYVLRLLSSCLEGKNAEQCFYVATGVGGNGKSKLMDLMRYTMGDYQTSLQTTVLTRKRPESGAANPDMMAAKCRRFIYLQEPDDKEPLNTSRMKQLSGEDMIEARPLYGDQEKFVIMGKLFMMCNKLPPVTTMDRGTWRRIRVLEFVSKFVDPDHPEYIAKRPNVFLKDFQLDRKLREWREPFLSLLVHVYENEYIPLGLNPVPAAVMRASDKYKESFDAYARFRAERIRQPVTPEEKLEFRAEPMLTRKIENIFRAWKKEVGVIGLEFAEVVKRLTEEFDEPINGGKEWPTIRVFGNDDEVVEWDRDHQKS